MELGNFVFKPKNRKLAVKVISHFCNKFLGWEDCGVWAAFSPVDKNEPEGYIIMTFDSENVDTERFTECCFTEEPVDAEDLTEHMFVLLDEEGFFDCPGEENGKFYSLEDRELSEVVSALSQNSSRVISFWSTHVFLTDKDEKGDTRSRRESLIDYALNASFEDKVNKAA
tara:strand:- start:50 stop:559 length:510 start_codon:yes stop_codon:yes gene_type:complete